MVKTNAEEQLKKETHREKCGHKYVCGERSALDRMGNETVTVDGYHSGAAVSLAEYCSTFRRILIF